MSFDKYKWAVIVAIVALAGCGRGQSPQTQAADPVTLVPTTEPAVEEPHQPIKDSLNQSSTEAEALSKQEKREAFNRLTPEEKKIGKWVGASYYEATIFGLLVRVLDVIQFNENSATIRRECAWVGDDKKTEYSRVKVTGAFALKPGELGLKFVEQHSTTADLFFVGGPVKVEGVEHPCDFENLSGMEHQLNYDETGETLYMELLNPDGVRVKRLPKRLFKLD